MANKIVLGLPKGSLQEKTVELFKKAGFRITIKSRSYYPSIDDPEIECILLRAQEIPRYVESGVIDIGISGQDWIQENDADVQELCEMRYAKQGASKVRWVLAVHNDSPVHSVADLKGKKIATEAINMTKAYLKKNGVKAEVEFSWGATEIKTPRLVDAIVDITETGSSLRANNLRIVDTICESTTRFIMNNLAYEDEWKRSKAEEISMLLKSVLDAQKKSGIMLNVERANKDQVLHILPALHTPTVSDLTDTDWCEIVTIVEKSELRDIIPKLKAAGATGIVEYSINKIID